MAQKILIKLTDDLDPSKEADETVSFALDGTSYEIDLTKKNADKFRGHFQDYIAAGRKVSGGKTRMKTKTTKAREVREWAKANGRQVPDRGRIPASVQDAYDSAH